VTLAAQWQDLLPALPGAWREASFRLRLEDTGRLDRAAAVLAPLQPVRSAPASLSFRAARDGSGPSPEMVARLLELLGRERLDGALEVVSTAGAEARATSTAPQASLTASWDAALATLPADWSDLLAEVELDSSDFLERAALHLAPINPRRDGDRDRLALRFRGARSFGYGGSPQMVRRSFERCDEDGIRGRVSVLWALSQTRPVGTQGPVWLLDGRTV